MANTRHDHERDLDYIPRTYDDGPEYPSVFIPRRPLTSTEQNYRARRIEEEHAHAKGRPMLDPSAAELAALSDETRSEMVARIRQMRDIVRGAGGIGLEQTVSMSQSPDDQPGV